MKHRLNRPIIHDLLRSDYRDKPFSGMWIAPEEPYSDYAVGYINFDKRSGRLQILLRKTRDETLGTSYARYLYQIYYWKEYKKVIPPGFEVDHINGNFEDNSLVNLQLLTKEQNIFKGAIMRGCLDTVLLCPVCQQLFFRIPSRSVDDNDVWNASCCCADCCHKLHLTKLPPETIGDIKSKQHLYTIRKHWFDYEDWLLDYYPHTEILEFGSRKLFHNGKRCDDIPGLTEYCWAYITPMVEQIAVIKNMLMNGMTYVAIREKLNIGEKRFEKFMSRFLPEFMRPHQQDKRDITIRALLNESKSVPEISRITGISYTYIYALVKRERPELVRPTVTQAELKSLIPKVIELKEAGTTGKRIAEILGIKYSTVMTLCRSYIYN